MKPTAKITEPLTRRDPTSKSAVVFPIEQRPSDLCYRTEVPPPKSDFSDSLATQPAEFLGFRQTVRLKPESSLNPNPLAEASGNSQSRRQIGVLTQPLKLVARHKQNTLESKILNLDPGSGISGIWYPVIWNLRIRDPSRRDADVLGGLDGFDLAGIDRGRSRSAEERREDPFRMVFDPVV